MRIIIIKDLGHLCQSPIINGGKIKGILNKYQNLKNILQKRVRDIKNPKLLRNNEIKDNQKEEL